MSVIAWDGFELAADKMCTQSGLTRTVTKIYRINDFLVGSCGDLDEVNRFFQWVKDGEKSKDFPLAKDCPEWSDGLIIRRDGTMHTYARSYLPVHIEDKLFAMGSGSDFAVAAMACGKNSREAVEIACKFNAHCGNGVDTLKLRDKQTRR
jgi:hypothetical protein